MNIFEQFRQRERAANRKQMAIMKAQDRVERVKRELKREVERLRKIKATPLDKFYER